MPKRRRKTSRVKRCRVVGRKRAKAAYCRNLRRLALRARTTQERVDAQDAIAAHNRSGDISNEYAQQLLDLMKR